MRTSHASELAVLLALSVLLIVIIAALPSNPLRVVLGLPFVLFFPGYALVAALFPGRSDLGGVERLALSIGLSIAVVPLVGLILNYTPWGIALYPILTAAFLFIASASAIAWYRRRQLPEDERFSVRFAANLGEWAAVKGWDRALGLLLVLLAVGAIGTIAYAATTPATGEAFTQFYVLGPDGRAEGYPDDLRLGEQGLVILGAVNNEHKDGLLYHVDMLIDGEMERTIGPIELDHEQAWEMSVGFTPARTGDDQLVEFLLYQQGDEDPCESLQLRIDVAGPD